MRNIICSFFGWIIGQLLPLRFKRSMFALAVNVKLANMRVLHDPTVDKLNAKLNLVEYTDVLSVMQERFGDRILDPQKVDGFVVNHREALCRGDLCPTDEVIQRLATNMIHAAPRWVNYGDAKMQSDVSSIAIRSKAELANTK